MSPPIYPTFHLCYILQLSLFVIFLLTIPFAASAVSNAHTQTWTSETNNSSWNYCITIRGESGPCGIISIIPDGFSYQSSNLPGTQVRQINSTVLFSLPDGGNLTFTIIGEKGSTGTISGTHTDFLAGVVTPLSPLYLLDGTIQPRPALQPDNPVANNQKKESPGLGPLITSIALAVVASILSQRRRL